MYIKCYLSKHEDWKQGETASPALLKGNKIHLQEPLDLTVMLYDVYLIHTNNKVKTISWLGAVMTKKVTAPDQEIFLHISPRKTATCHFYTFALHRLNKQNSLC